jgi:hypothetical protein
MKAMKAIQITDAVYEPRGVVGFALAFPGVAQLCCSR